MKAAKWKPTATVAAEATWTWAGVLRTSELKAEQGFRFFKKTLTLPDDETGEATEWPIEYLEYRDGNGLLRGVVGYQTLNAGLHIVVDPAYRRQGIATKLMNEAAKRWPIDFERQSYTPDGAQFFRKFLNRAPHRAHGNPRKLG